MTETVAAMVEPRSDTAPVLSLQDLHVTFAGGVHAVRGVTLDVHSGEVLALVGESGSGKSALGLAALGLLPATARLRGAALLGGTDMVTASDAVRRAARRAHAGAVFQDPMTSLNPSMKVGRQVAEAGDDVDVATFLRAAGIADPELRAGQYPHELSGGLRQRVMIAMAVAGAPALVVADEPTTALDVLVQAEVLRLFRRLCDTTGTSVVFVTHDLAVAASVADRIAVLYGGRLLELGTAREVLQGSAHPYTAGLLASRTGPTSRKDVPLPTLPGEPPDPRRPEPGCAFAPRCGLAHVPCTTALPELLPSSRHAGHDACVRSSEPVDVRLQAVGSWPRQVEAGGEGDALLLDDITKAFGRRGARRVVLDGVSLAVPRGGSLALVGESGCGKTTTLRIAVGLETADGGAVRLDAGDRPQLVAQDAGASLTPWLKVGELLEERLRADGQDRAARRTAVSDVLALVGLPPEVALARPRQLSGGQRQRVALARAVVVPPRLLACDEPISALDVSLAAVVLNLLGRLRRELGLALLFVTHDLAAARLVADEVAVMHDGRIVEHGRADDVLFAPQHAHTQALLAAVPTIGRG
ncbi:MAG: peptide/nickel transport system ATP-binding protein ddpF [Frankiaceae bacterium]|nr:peptide/nickel transport system ATP-binding protein ddpF [Frankiaceae bacterium]